jgi:hypothetical protein
MNCWCLGYKVLRAAIEKALTSIVAKPHFDFSASAHPPACTPRQSQRMRSRLRSMRQPAVSGRRLLTSSGQNVNSIHQEILLQISELTKNLTILVSSAQSGDPNITTINNQISALS